MKYSNIRGLLCNFCFQNSRNVWKLFKIIPRNSLFSKRYYCADTKINVNSRPKLSNGPSLHDFIKLGSLKKLDENVVPVTESIPYVKKSDFHNISRKGNFCLL